MGGESDIAAERRATDRAEWEAYWKIRDIDSRYKYINCSDVHSVVYMELQRDILSPCSLLCAQDVRCPCLVV